MVQEALKVTYSAKRSGLSDRSFYEPCNLCSGWESGYERKKQYFLFVLPFFEAATDVIKMKVSQEDLENTALSMEQKGIPIFFFIVPFFSIHQDNSVDGIQRSYCKAQNKAQQVAGHDDRPNIF